MEIAWEIFWLVGQLIVTVWVSALLVAIARQWFRGRFIGMFELVGYVWRGEVGR